MLLPVGTAEHHVLGREGFTAQQLFDELQQFELPYH